MIIAIQYIYLVALLPFCFVWGSIFYFRKDLRQEMLLMSLMVGILSILSAYYWWTVDWWLPPNITNTRVGVEDFIMGFTSGGIMASVYEVIFKRGLYKRKLHHHASAGWSILLFLSQTTMLLFWGVGLTSFWASSIGMFLTALIMLSVRKDLIMTSFLSGLLMATVSFLFYGTIILLSPAWLEQTYLHGLSGIRTIGVPIEEYIFWFLAGTIFGPFYEYWQGEKLKKLNI